VKVAIIKETRTLMIEQYTLGTTHNQKINEDRLRARTRAFQSLIAALILALVAAVVILAHNAVRGRNGGGIPIQAWN
jgi:cell division protein FtsX